MQNIKLNIASIWQKSLIKRRTRSENNKTLVEHWRTKEDVWEDWAPSCHEQSEWKAPSTLKQHHLQLPRTHSSKPTHRITSRNREATQHHLTGSMRKRPQLEIHLFEKRNKRLLSQFHQTQYRYTHLTNSLYGTMGQAGHISSGATTVKKHLKTKILTNI